MKKKQIYLKYKKIIFLSISTVANIASSFQKREKQFVQRRNRENRMVNNMLIIIEVPRGK